MIKLFYVEFSLFIVATQHIRALESLHGVTPVKTWSSKAMRTSEAAGCLQYPGQ